MKTLLPFCVVILIASLADGFSISNADVQGSQGREEENPIEQDSSFSLNCDLDLQSGESWVLCMWTHEIEDTEDNVHGGNLRVVCATSPDGSKTCKNDGGSDELGPYASRIQMTTSSNRCGITVNSAEPWDDGRWECKVTDAGIGNVQQYSYIDLHVANQSKIFITEPDLMEYHSETIPYDLEDERDEIESTCRAFGGKPEPTFRWYLNDDRTEIDESDLNARDFNGQDGILGEYKEQRISFQPTVDDFCDKYDLDERLCESNSNRRKRKYRKFDFQLICKVEQMGDSQMYYQQENEDQVAEVTVEVTSGSLNVSSSVSVVSLLCGIHFLIKMFA